MYMYYHMITYMSVVEYSAEYVHVLSHDHIVQNMYMYYHMITYMSVVGYSAEYVHVLSHDHIHVSGRI